MWPRLSPHEFLHDLLGARALLAAAGKGILERGGGAAPAPAPQRLARRGALDGGRHGARSTRPAPCSARAAGHGPHRARGQRNEEALAQEVGFWPQGLAASPAPATSPVSGGDDEVRSFGHIVVDEVQDLSPMQLRMLARRSLSGSMTVVGDIAQATGPVGPGGLGRHHAPPEPAAPAAAGRAHRELPHPGGGRGAGGAGPGGGGALHRAPAAGAPVRPRAAHRLDQPGRAAGHAGRAGPRRGGGRRARVGWPCWDPPSCCPS